MLVQFGKELGAKYNAGDMISVEDAEAYARKLAQDWDRELGALVSREYNRDGYWEVKFACGFDCAVWLESFEDVHRVYGEA